MEPKETEENTGSSDSGISLTFVYKDGSKRFLELSTEEEEEGEEVAVYTELSYESYIRKDSEYTTNVEVWRDVLMIMLKGEMRDLNKQ